MIKPLSEQDHYEVLELSYEASADEIARAYRLACATYAEDSLAGYSVFGTGDAHNVRERIETAYRVLSDPESRAIYDASQGRFAPDPPASDPLPPEPPVPGPSPADALPPETPPRPLAPAAAPRPPLPAAAPRATALPERQAAFEVFEDTEEESGEYDGAHLRRARARRGLALDDVAAVTRIKVAHLRSIEEERFEELPTRVYVRGFVSAYASCVGLDPQAAAAGYMRRFDEAGSSRDRWASDCR